ncbi:MAG: hypothetical protein QOI94_2616, partial [Acidobacteriaceae bacterium]|nr:hypothetical protein [Acidobacteriaceae bacterium]
WIESSVLSCAAAVPPTRTSDSEFGLTLHDQPFAHGGDWLEEIGSKLVAISADFAGFADFSGF